ncbi:MAG: DUF4062 domain-containing protein [Desulfuromonadales bacterium]
MLGPKAFIASTCHDMEEERRGLKDYLENIGWEPVLSESKFGVMPSLNSHDACLAQLQRCHIFVLIIGFRYGGSYIRDPSISITHKEFRVARELKLPMYIFIREGVIKNVENLNLDGTSSSFNREPYAIANRHSCESQLTERIEAVNAFVNEVRKLETSPEYHNRSNWLFRFNTPASLVDSLREQLGFLTSVLLDIYITGVSKLVKIEVFGAPYDPARITFYKKNDENCVKFILSEAPIESTLLVWEDTLCLTPQAFNMVGERTLESYTNLSGLEAEPGEFTVRYEYTQYIKATQPIVN